MDKPTLAFLGQGLMGQPMTLRLLQAGYRVHVWNRSRPKLQPAIDRGAIEAETPREAAKAADIVLLCLLDTRAVEEVAFGADGIAGAEGRGKVLVDHSSISPDATRVFAERLASRSSMQWVDAPVSGGVKGAQEGTLAIMCGGHPEAIDRVRPALAAYARNITHMGPAGTGQTTKLCNQVIVGSAVAVMAEAVTLAQNAGVDARRLIEAFSGGFADSKPLQIFLPRMVAGWDDEPIGAANLFLKDLDTAADLARASGTPLPMASLARELFRQLAAQGRGEEDPASLVTLYRKPK
ncbi:MAG: NAD(P)-dependent oxidoreductase [Candidatus Binatia bacterium]